MSPRAALVTGASGALGGAVARLLDQRGFAVAVHYKSNEQLAHKLAAELANPTTVVAADLADWVATRAMVEAVQERLGPVAVLVNAGAVRRDGLMATQSAAEWARTIEVNLIGTFHACRAVLPEMLRQRYGRIVNVVSPAALIGSPGQTAYSAAKAGVIGMTRSLALECGRRRVTVNALSPGFMPTSLTGDVPESVHAEVRRRTAFGRTATPQDVICGVDFLLAADYMTGQVISIDGGISIS